jgi:site-specific recombinase XerD
VNHSNKGIGLQDLLEGFLFSLQAEGRSPQTHEFYSKYLGCLLKYSKSQSWPECVDQLEVRHFREFLTWVATRSFEYIAGKNSRRVVQPRASKAWRYYKAIRRLFNWSVEEGLLGENPIKTLRYKTPPPPPIQPYNLDELKRFLAVCELDIKSGARFCGLRNKGMLLLFLDSGLRSSELAFLNLSDIDLEQRMVRVVGKGKKIGVCPFSSKTAKAIWLYLLERKKRAKSNALWITEEGGPFTLTGISSWFVRLKQRAGVNGEGRLHRLRHTAALQYLRGAKDSFLLQLFLRHEDLTMSRRYTQGLKQEEAVEAHRNGASPVEGLGLG